MTPGPAGARVWKCSRCGYERFVSGAGEEREVRRTHACPADRPELRKIMGALARYLDRARARHAEILGAVDWKSKDPGQLPVAEAEKLVADLRALGTLLDVFRRLADEQRSSAVATLVGLQHERQRRLDQEYEWPAGYPPVPVV